MNNFEIYDPHRSIALSSSAGSGKTFALTTRLLSMLLTGIKPSEVLAITFTNLAANEIRDRLFSRLLAIEAGDDQELSLFTRILGVSSQTLIEMARSAEREVVRQFSLLQISTIHSFFLRIIQTFPEKTGFLPDLAVVDEGMKKPLFDKAFERFYERLSKGPGLIERVYRFITSFRGDKLASGSVIREVYKEVDVKYSLLREAFSFSGREISECEKRFIRARRLLASADTFRDIRLVLEYMETHIEKYGDNRNIRSFLRELQGFLRYKKIKALAALSPFKRDPGSGMIRYLETVYKNLQPEEAQRFQEALVSIRTSLLSYLTAEMHYYLSTWFMIYSMIREEYDRIKQNARFLDFNDIEFKAADFLKELDDFEYLRSRIHSKIRYILIDEFQDTSENQWDALKYIVRNSVQEGGAIFYVGDVKQSIYRWRGGEPYLFDKVRSDFNIAKKSLSYNYRQNPLLVDFVNRVFKGVRKHHLPNYLYEEQLVPQYKKQEKRGYLLIKQHREREEVFEEIVQQIQRLQIHGVNYRDIAVLCRTNREGEEVEASLFKGKIPYASAGRSKLLKDYAVLDMINILRFVLNPWDELALGGILRSPLFRYTYDQLQSCKTNAGSIAPESLKGSDPEAHEKISLLLRASHYATPARFFRSVYEELGIVHIYPLKTDVLLEFYELAYAFERNSDDITLSDYYHYLQENTETIPLRARQEHGVTVQTIHSSKGLEYHTVVVPFLNQPFKFRLDGSILYKRNDERNDAGEKARFILAKSVYMDYFKGQEPVKEILAATDMNYRIDELNALYVAVTRARENLILLPLARSRADSMGDVLISAFDPLYEKGESPYIREVGEPVRSMDETRQESRTYEAVECFDPRLSKEQMREGEALEGSLDIFAPLDSSFMGVGSAALSLRGYDSRVEDLLVEDVQKRRIGLLRGLVFHRALERIERLPVDERTLINLLNRAVSLEGSMYNKEERKKALEGAKVSLLNLLEDERMKRYFCPKAVSEVETFSTGFANLLGRIDRILLGQEIEVVDFKTDALGGNIRIDALVDNYRRQVITYCTTIGKVFPQKRIFGFLYFTNAEYEERIVEVYRSGEA